MMKYQFLMFLLFSAFSAKSLAQSNSSLIKSNVTKESKTPLMKDSLVISLKDILLEENVIQWSKNIELTESNNKNVVVTNFNKNTNIKELKKLLASHVIYWAKSPVNSSQIIEINNLIENNSIQWSEKRSENFSIKN